MCIEPLCSAIIAAISQLMSLKYHHAQIIVGIQEQELLDAHLLAFSYCWDPSRILSHNVYTHSVIVATMFGRYW